MESIMINTNILYPSPNRNIIDAAGSFSIIEYVQDISTSVSEAQTAFFASQMNIRKRQVMATLNGTGIVLQSGAMQMTMGSIEAATNIKGAGDMVKKLVGSKVTGESVIKPRYSGYGLLVTEPTYRYILLEDVANWNGQMIIDDGLFLACESTVDLGVVARSTLSSAVLGNEGLFNTVLKGAGIVALESPVPREELIEVVLENDVLKIDGNMAIAWSGSLKFTVERTTKTLIGSAASKEGLVNVYRGSGRVLIAPVS